MQDLKEKIFEITNTQTLLLNHLIPTIEELKWQLKIFFDNLVSRMVKFDIENYKIGV